MVSTGSKTKPRKTCMHQPLHDLARLQEGPHIWLVESLELYKICPTMSLFMWEKMKPWRTSFHLNHNKGMMTSRPIEI